jgi:glycosyltransferase involved in cell wall biosynthesis
MSQSVHVGVFRHTLFLPSEPFIPLQAQALPARVTYLARDAIVDPPSAVESATIAESGELAAVRHTLGDPGPLTELLRRVAPDIVHAHFGVEGVAAAGAARRTSLPLVTTLHGYDATLSANALLRARKINWARFAVARRRFLRESDHLIAVSHHIARRAIEHGAREEAITVLYTGVDTQAFAPAPLPEAPTVLHVARLVEKKGTSDLLAAFATVLRTVPDARLRIIGDGPLRPALTAQAHALGIAGAVTFEGVQPHSTVREAMKQTTLLCQPSVTAGTGDQEGLGQVALEAAATARPVVATRHGGLSEAVSDGATGVLVDEHDTAALASAIGAILADPAQAAALGDAGRTWTERHFDAAANAADVERLYRSILSR